MKSLFLGLLISLSCMAERAAIQGSFVTYRFKYIDENNKKITNYVKFSVVEYDDTMDNYTLKIEKNDSVRRNPS